MIIGTAGHIDHGKSTLVEALTGKRMDRLAEERARGITIDLNFAPLRLADGEIAGVVDVPGHEDFVRTMVAGAAGVDLVLLVIAADEGIKPQTREHLAIVEALGVPRGIPVLTKCDRVDADRLALVQGEVDGLAGKNSPVAFVGALPVSARTGAGLGDLLAAVHREAAELRPRDESAPFRMPIDRAFSLPGAGTIVTGSVWSGSAGPGDDLRLLPAGRSVRVRAVEVHGTRSERARPGNRAALGLSNVERDQVRPRRRPRGRRAPLGTHDRARCQAPASPDCSAPAHLPHPRPPAPRHRGSGRKGPPTRAHPTRRSRARPAGL